MQTLLAWLTDAALADAIAGDLEEGYRARRVQSPAGAHLWYLRTFAGLVVTLSVQRLAEGAGSCGGALRLQGAGGEIRQAGRSLRRTPVMTLVVVTTLALGFGMNTAIFSVVHGVLFQPLPFDRPDEILFVQGTRRGEAPSPFGSSYPDYLDLSQQQRTLSSLATTAYWTFTVTGTPVPLRVIGHRVTGSFFELMGMRPLLGRWIAPEDDHRGGPEVVVLSEGFWQRVFGGDPAAIGRTLALNGVPAKVIGVMPSSFRFPFDDVELWAPMLGEFDGTPRQSRFFATIGRLKRGTALAEAQKEFTALAGDLETAHPDTNRNWRPVLRPALPVLTAHARPRLILLFGAVVVVLLVAAVNVTTLILSRATARQREFSVRSALGASRVRLVRMTLLESAWLGAWGLGLGLLLAAPSITVLRSLAPDGIPRLSNVTLNWPVALWAASAMALFVVTSAVAPILAMRRTQAASLRSATVAGSPRSRARRALMVSQVAGAFALLVATGLLVRSFGRVLAVDPGFDPANLATVRVFLTPPTYRTIDQQTDYVTRALMTLEQTPGVVAAAAVSQPPFDRDSAGTTLSIAVEGRSYAPGTHPVAAYRATSVSYFETVGLRVREGRRLTADDRRGAPLVVVINRAMAATFWPGASPIGKRFEFADGRNAGPVTVVGVADDVATDGLERNEGPAMYAPHVQRTLPFLRWMTLVARTHADVNQQLATIRARLQALDPNQPLFGITSMNARVAASLAERRFSLVLMTMFAGLTLVLAAMGLYGTLAQRVGERAREIGVRLALGAVPSQVFRLVMTEGVWLVALGAGVGAVAVWLSVPLIRESLFGVTPADRWTYAAIVTLLAAVTILASWIPARAAAQTDPVRTLRDD